MAHYFRLKCLNTDQILRKQTDNLNKRKSETTTTETTPIKKTCTETPRKPNVVKIEAGNFQKVFLKSITSDRSIEKKMAEIHDDEQAGSCSRIENEPEADSLESVLAALEGKEQFVIENKDEEMSKTKAKRKKTKWEAPKTKDSAVDEEMTDNSELRSEIGEFSAEVIESVYGNKFCLADKYLFEFGLTKQGQRCYSFVCLLLFV